MADDNYFDRFWHTYYLLRVLGCFPALFYWLLFSVPSHYFSEEQIKLITSYQLTLTIPLVAIPILVLLRLRQIRQRFYLQSLSPETVLDAWLNHFVAFNVGSLGILGGWIATCTYLASIIGLSALFPKPAYLGHSKLRVMAPEKFAADVLNQDYSSVIGFSTSELLSLKPEEFEKRRHSNEKNLDSQFQSKIWIVWPISESRKRSQVGLMDMESILASLSLQYNHSKDLEFIILDMKNSTSLCSSLKIWSEDDLVSSPMQSDVDDLVLLKYQTGKEINRIPSRTLSEDDSSDEEESPSQKRAQPDPFYWNKETIIKAFDLK